MFDQSGSCNCAPRARKVHHMNRPISTWLQVDPSGARGGAFLEI